MITHGITAARYASEDTAPSAPVIATVRGIEQARRANDDIEGGGMLAYLAGGGTIALFVPDIAAARARRIEETWAEHARRFASYVVQVQVAGQTRGYRCDPVTRENLMAIVSAINAAPQLVPNPRPYTPSGALAPVDTSHDEFTAIYFAGLAAGDAHYAVYAAHKAAITALATASEIAAYDITAGWPS